MSDSRLDAALADRGLVRSRTTAARMIADGLVTVDGVAVIKPSARVTAEQHLEVAALDHYVSRAAHKLVGALDGFELPVRERVALDVGASTGGFTQVLLERGATSVIALDVGHAQLSPSIRSDPRVTVVEGFNARFMTSERLAEATRVAAGSRHRAVDPQGTDGGGSAVDSARIDLVVADLSFISLTTVLPALVDTIGTAADFVLLVKPQFEVGRGGIKEGIVRQPGLRTDALEKVLWAAWDLGLATAGILSSPIVGSAGNHEYLLWLSTARGADPSQWRDRVVALTTRGTHST